MKDVERGSLVVAVVSGPSESSESEAKELMLGFKEDVADPEENAALRAALEGPELGNAKSPPDFGAAMGTRAPESARAFRGFLDTIAPPLVFDESSSDSEELTPAMVDLSGRGSGVGGFGGAGSGVVRSGDFLENHFLLDDDEAEADDDELRVAGGGS